MDEIDQMLSHLRGRGDKLCSDAADEIELLRTALRFADAKLNGWLDAEYEEAARAAVRAALATGQTAGKCDDPQG